MARLIMKNDFDHWEQLGLNQGFEAYIQQKREATAPHDPEVRKAWMKELMADSPGVVIKTPASVWLAISRGELDGQTAFMNGKFTVEGDLTLLFKMKKLFR